MQDFGKVGGLWDQTSRESWGIMLGFIEWTFFSFPIIPWEVLHNTVDLCTPFSHVTFDANGFPLGLV